MPVETARDCGNFIPGAFDLSYDSSDEPMVGKEGGKTSPNEQKQPSSTWTFQTKSKISLSEKPVAEVQEYIRSGFKPSEIGFTLCLVGLSVALLAGMIGVSERTIQRKIKENKRLDPEESDRIYRIQKVGSAALDLFEGNVESMRRWLKAPLPVLGGESPLGYSDTEPGARFVLDLINRLEHGVFS